MKDGGWASRVCVFCYGRAPGRFSGADRGRRVPRSGRQKPGFSDPRPRTGFLGAGMRIRGSRIGRIPDLRRCGIATLCDDGGTFESHTCTSVRFRPPNPQRRAPARSHTCTSVGAYPHRIRVTAGCQALAAAGTEDGGGSSPPRPMDTGYSSRQNSERAPAPCGGLSEVRRLRLTR